MVTEKYLNVFPLASKRPRIGDKDSLYHQMHFLKRYRFKLIKPYDFKEERNN